MCIGVDKRYYTLPVSKPVFRWTPGPGFDGAWERSADQLSFSSDGKFVKIADQYRENLTRLSKLREQLDDADGTEAENLKKEISAENQTVVSDFHSYLEEALGPQRKNLIPIIKNIFSQEPVIHLSGELDGFMMKKYRGKLIRKFSDRKPNESCVLVIPKEPNNPIVIRASIDRDCALFERPGYPIPRELTAPARVKASSIYRIAPNGKVQMKTAPPSIPASFRLKPASDA
jgi:hypothetical protein